LPSVTHYYVWYRVAGDMAAARTAIDALLHDVFANAGVMGRVLWRRDDPRRWMEIYENVADASLFEEKLERATLRHDVARFAEGGQRHVEPFLSLI
jgi:LPS sulfotransferase NodH